VRRNPETAPTHKRERAALQKRVLIALLATLVVSVCSCGSGPGSPKAGSVKGGLRLVEDGPQGILQITAASCRVPVTDPTEIVLSGHVTNRLARIAYPRGEIGIYNAAGLEVGQGRANLPFIMRPNQASNFSVAISIGSAPHFCELDGDNAPG
jgi:hypothetical protein